jgi:photosystem II stability/assembly factor-like uncharacterized protein
VRTSGVPAVSDETNLLFKTTNGGRSWQLKNRGIETGPIRKIVIDPLDPNRLFLAAWDRVYESVNGGESWSLFDLTGAVYPFRARELMIPPADPATLVVAGSAGVHAYTRVP